jgi:hypothetical protein
MNMIKKQCDDGSNWAVSGVSVLPKGSPENHDEWAPAMGVRKMPTIRAISMAYPRAVRHEKQAFGGYDVGGALMCFCHNLSECEAPGYMRYPTTGDVAECLKGIGWDSAAAMLAARQLCDLCDRASSERAWQFLDELLRRTARLKACSTDCRIVDAP